MHQAATRTKKIMLQGEWTVGEAVERQELLSGELALLLEAEPGPAGAEVDLSLVTALDPCGCQLLAVFLGNLERHGIAAETSGIPAEFAEQIRLLGFFEAGAPLPAPEKETP
jgi:anti-anti-sigma regulatory factor